MAEIPFAKLARREAEVASRRAAEGEQLQAGVDDRLLSRLGDAHAAPSLSESRKARTNAIAVGTHTALPAPFRRPARPSIFAVVSGWRQRPPARTPSTPAGSLEATN